MRMEFKKLSLAIACSMSLFMAGCNNGDDNNSNYNTSNYVSEIVYKYELLDEAASIKTMTYMMDSVQNKKVKATAMVMFPKVAAPLGGYKTVVWLHGTLGVGDGCAPTNNVLGPRFKDPLAKSLLTAGYVIVAPDYEGLGTPGIHPYLDIPSEAKSALFAVQAAQSHYGAQLSKSWMSIGQSQGGQASLGVAEFANTDANYKGAVAGAPASSLDQIIFDVAPSALAAAEQKEIENNVPLSSRAANGSIGAYATLLSYAAFAAVGVKASDPRFDYREIFAATRSQMIAELAEGTTGENGLCLDSQEPVNAPQDSLRYRFAQDIVQFLTDNPNAKLNDYPGLDQAKFKNSLEIQKFLALSQPGTQKIDKPILIIQGTADMSVPFPVTQELYTSMKKLGSNVELLPVVDASHTEAIVRENQAAIDFIQKYMPAK